jgi:predicted phosphodiesterase
MRLAVLSDIHGNLVALEAALADLEAAGEVDEIWCLGDLAVFGSRPAECIRRVRALIEEHGEKKFKVIGGNTDRYLVTGERFPAKAAKDEETFQKMVRTWGPINQALLWNAEQISFEDYEFLAKIVGKELRLKAEGYGPVIGYHAIPGDDEAMLTPDTAEEEALDAVLDRQGRLGIGGHIHIQMDREVGHWRLVNVGSVGMAYDNPGKVHWGLFTFDDGAVTVDLRSVAYDTGAAIADLEAVGHPAPEWVARTLRPK